MKRRLVVCVIGFLMFISAAFALYEGIIWPEAEEIDVKHDSKLTVDVSNMADGYLMIKGDANSKHYKLRIAYGKNTLTYDLNNEGEYEIFPLQLGSGKYTVSLYVNAGGKKYSAAGTIKLNAQLNAENGFMLVPNQYVAYAPDSAAVALSDELCANAATDRDKFEAVRAYIKENYEYDYKKAATVTSGTMPDIDYALENKMGICQDLSALVACLLRVQGIPTRFVIGYINKQYHAWNMITIDGEEFLYDATAEIGGVNTGRYTVERYY